ncbi:MAG: AraC family transcriptional regulator [Segetibacter sp.]
MKTIFQHHSSTLDSSFIVKEYCQSHFTSPFHFHDTHELILIKKSYGKLYAGNKVMNFNEGEIFLFGPGFSHCFYNDKSFINSKEIAHAIVIFFKEDFLGDVFLKKPELINIRKLLNRSLAGIKVNKASDLMSSYFLKIRGEKGMKPLLLLLQLLDLLSLQKKNNLSPIITTSGKASSNNLDHSKLEAVFKYVLENFKENANSKKAASLAFLNEAAFCRYFKRRTQKTFSQFVNDVRITHATKLLVEKDWSIANICYECGYNNISYFNREFQVTMGMTPFAYRKSISQLEEEALE